MGHYGELISVKIIFRVKLPIPRLFLYRESSYTETHFKGESCFKHFTRTAFDNIPKKFIRENRMKLFSHQKPELGPLLPEIPWLKCQKVPRFVANNQTRLSPILGLG